jgi:P-type Ca2+ transporter type 2C
VPAEGPPAEGWNAEGWNAEGLTSAEAADRLARHGPNELRRPQRPRWWVRVGAALREPLVLVLLAAAVLTTVTGDLADTVVILVVVLVNTGVAVWQQARAERAVSALSSLTTPMCRVLRDGAETLLASTLLVPGDTLRLGEGDVVPADGRVVEAVALRVDESALTGESVPVDKAVPVDRAVPVDKAVRPADELSDQVRAGTTVVHGRATVVVGATGDDSALGQIAGLIGLAGVRTPLQRRMAQLSRILAVVALVLCALVMVVGLVRGESLELMVLTAISLVVAAVPESLPVVVTLSLALGARRMARRRAVVRDLAAVETLGSVTLLATDKTGTLTRGAMTVSATWCPDGVDEAELLRATVLCNDARLTPDGDEHLGDPTEIALLEAAARRGIEQPDLGRRLPRIGELPFDSDRRRMTTAHRPAGGRTLVVCKGAPESLLDTGIVRSPDAVLHQARDRSRQLAQGGERVLAVARRDRSATGPDRPEDWERDLTLLGLVALHDPPRPSSRSTVQACRRAGIRVVLITGDGPQTATAVARDVGIDTAGAVVDLAGGTDLATVPGAAVLARATPADKRAAVRLWQQQGEVVAMTGDGVNDGPALRRADIGVAMGRRGTDVARQAADLVLADDELATVVVAVEEGRRVYANIRRFLLYGLSGGAAELMVMLVGPLVGLALPLLPAQILWVNLLTHSLAGTALGAEPAEPGLLDRPPRDPDEGVLGAGLWWRVLLLATGLTGLSLLAGVLAGTAAAAGPVDPRSAVLLVLGAGQLGVALGARARTAPRSPRRERNWALPASVAVAALLLVAAIQLEPLRVLLETGDVVASSWVTAAVAVVTGWWGARAAGANRRRGRAASGPSALRSGPSGHQAGREVISS